MRDRDLTDFELTVYRKVGEADENAPGGNAAHEGACAVDGIDDPANISVPAFPEFFAQYGVVGIAGG